MTPAPAPSRTSSVWEPPARYVRAAWCAAIGLAACAWMYAGSYVTRNKWGCAVACGLVAAAVTAAVVVKVTW